MAMHPFDDSVEPISRSWEDLTRQAAMRFSAGVRSIRDPAEAENLARNVVSGYRDSAIAVGDPHYSGRYDQALSATDDD